MAFMQISMHAPQIATFFGPMMIVMASHSSDPQKLHTHFPSQVFIFVHPIRGALHRHASLQGGFRET
ncbi:hypothetical protein B0G71_3452 [Paraburkholderia sp. BL27I4N3]|nr:hypothetical protein B0G71_3452 [Paraburkholderia sp. BL27I4N3]